MTEHTLPSDYRDKMNKVTMIDYEDTLKASELISHLQKSIALMGDLPVRFEDNEARCFSRAISISESSGFIGDVEDPKPIAEPIMLIYTI